MTEELRKTVLIVDDHQDIQTVMSFTLQQFGYATFVAGSGIEAIETAIECQPDIVIVDYRLPDTDGITLGKQIRDLAVERKIHLVLFSGNSDLEIQSEASAAGFSAFILKPVRMKHLKMQLERLDSSQNDEAT